MSQNQDSTVDYRSQHFFNEERKWHGWLAYGLGVFLIMSFSFYIGRYLWPRETVKMVETKVSVEKNTSSSGIYFKNQRDLELLTTHKIKSILRSNKGVFEVRDHEAMISRYKRAAVFGKTGYIDLKNNVSYKIYDYYLCADNGHGMIWDGEQMLFTIIWYAGKTPAPPTNPGSIHIPSGIKVALGDAPP